jgi:RHS repeat-associated protein
MNKGTHMQTFFIRAVSGLLLLLPVFSAEARVVEYIHTDAQGTIVAISDASGAVTQRFDYEPYGLPMDTRQKPDGAGYTGHVHDADSGLIYMQQRYYDAVTGRFISTDPVGVSASTGANFNRYNYANNNPTTLADPDGLFVVKPITPIVKPIDDKVTLVVEGAGAITGGSPTVQGQGGVKPNNRVGTTGQATVGPTAEEIARAQAIMDKSVVDVAMELGWELLKDFVGYNDLVGCLEADIMSCGMLAAGITPWGKGLKAVKVLYKMIDGAVTFYKTQKKARKTLEAARKECNSFVPGTLVLLADGSTKPIEDIELGDDVVTAHEDTGELAGTHEVTATITGHGFKNLVTITTAGDTDHDGKADQVTATDRHPFWVPALRKWVDADQLQVGDWLLTDSGAWAQIVDVQHAARVQTVHNLTVSGAHTYYVVAGDTRVLNHNAVCGNHRAEVEVRDGDGEFKLAFCTGSGCKQAGESNLQAHTESRVNRMFGGSVRPRVKDDRYLNELAGELSPGDSVVIRGSNPPCSRCKGAMNTMVRELGANVTYEYGDGMSWTATGGRRRR